MRIDDTSRDVSNMDRESHRCYLRWARHCCSLMLDVQKDVMIGVEK